MLEINYKNFQPIVVETIQDYLDNNPTTDLFDKDIELDDLVLDNAGNVAYLFSYKNTSYCDAETGYNTVHETSNEKYAILIEREHLKELIKRQKQNA